MLLTTATALLIAAGNIPTPAADDPMIRPIVGTRTAEWLAPRTPSPVYGNTYLVGFAGLNVALIDTGRGLILVDGALPQAAPAILENVRRLGRDPREIRYILSTEPHFDHAGALAALARETGATVLASRRAAAGLRSGRLAADDPQHSLGHSFYPVTRVRVVRDRQPIRLGNTVVVPYYTPGHTAGSVSWGWRACEDKICRDIVFAASLNPVSGNEYRFSARENREVINALRRSQDLFDRLPCDILISSHPGPEHLERGHSQGKGACRAYAARSRQALSERLTEERESSLQGAER